MIKIKLNPIRSIKKRCMPQPRKQPTIACLADAKTNFSFRVREIAAQTPKPEQMMNVRKIR